MFNTLLTFTLPRIEYQGEWLSLLASLGAKGREFVSALTEEGNNFYYYFKRPLAAPCCSGSNCGCNCQCCSGCQGCADPQMTGS